ncbi:coil containing protein [Vibrio phage 1.250.O._10N.261.55.E11]|nr:coil containing protein [Vibrio phage 1.250.O._10N.261.55.E11]
MAVGIDINIDPSGAVSGGRVATTSLDKIDKSADGATSAIARLEKEMAVLTVKQQQGSKAAAVFASTQSLAGKATDVQRVQIEQLTGEVYDLQVATAGAGKTMDTYGRSSMNVANVGYQIQDSMVQAQMGTSGFVIAAQQLPQALVGFGAIGSVVGTAVAVVSVGLMALNPNLADATTSTDKLTDTMKDLNTVVDQTSFGVVGLSDDMLTLYGTSEQLAKVQLSLAFSKATLAIEQASDAALEATSDFGTFFTDLSAGAVNLEELDKRTQALSSGLVKSVEDIKNAGTFVGQGQIVSSVELLSDKFKIAESDSIALLRSYQALQAEKSPENIAELSDIVSNITLNTPAATLAFRQFAADIGEVSQKASSASEIINFVNGAMTDLGATVSDSTKQTKGYTDEIRILELRLQGLDNTARVTEEILRNTSDESSAVAGSVSEATLRIIELEQALKAADRVEELKDEISILGVELSQGSVGARAYAAALNLGENATEDQKNAVKALSIEMSALQQQLKVDDSFIEMGQQLAVLELTTANQLRSAAQLRAEYALGENATSSQIKKARELAGSLFDAQKEQKQVTKATNLYKNEVKSLLPDITSYEVKSKALRDVQALGVLSTQELSVAMANLNKQFDPDSITFAESFNLQFQQTVEGAQNMEASLGEIYGNTFGTLSSSIGQATADMILFGASGEDAARQVAQAVAGQLISSLVELGVQWALNAALGETLAAASLATTSASAAATGVAWATPAALASLATLGTNAVPAAAAVTGTVAAAQGVALTSAIPAFAEGGLAYGPGTGKSDSFTALLSNGEFVMPQRETARNLGTLQSMRAGNDVTSGSGDRKIVIQNYTTGRIDSVEQYTTADEVRILIREEVPNVVSAEFNDEYSNTNKAVQSQYTMQRKF